MENNTKNQIEQCAPEDCASCKADCSSRLNLDQQVIEITTDDGTPLRCLIVLKFEMEGRDYLAVMPLRDNPEGDIYLFRMVKGGAGLDNIEDQDEYARAARAFGLAMEKKENAGE